MIRWLRGETVGDSCPEMALIFCAMVAEGFLSPFSVGCSLFILSNVSLPFCQLFLFSSISCFSLLRQLFLFSFHWILLFSCRRRLCALSFYRPLLIPCAHLDASTTLDSRLRSCFLRSICTFCTLNP